MCASWRWTAGRAARLLWQTLRAVGHSSRTGSGVMKTGLSIGTIQRKAILYSWPEGGKDEG